MVWTWPGKEGHPFSQLDVATGVGPSVLAAAQDPAKYNQCNILLQAERISVEDIVAKISKTLGKPGRVQYEDPTKFATLFEGAQELANMVQWFEEYGYYGPETETRKHNSGKDIGGLISFDAWLESEEYKKFM